MTDTPLVEMRHIEKSYGRVHALRDVNLTIRKGEIVGLLGDNGAGKSTLIKVLSGAVPYTSGEIRIKDKPVRMTSTNDAIAAGIETIYHVPGIPVTDLGRFAQAADEGAQWFTQLQRHDLDEVQLEDTREVLGWHPAIRQAWLCRRRTARSRPTRSGRSRAASRTSSSPAASRTS